MEEAKMRELFETLKGQVGRTLFIMRKRRNLDLEQVVANLKNQSTWERATKNSLELIEEGSIETSFEKFCAICVALGYTPERGLNSAQRNRTIDELCSQMEPEEVLDMIKEEGEYFLWKTKRQSGDIS